MSPRRHEDRPGPPGVRALDRALTRAEHRVVAALHDPPAIQAFLDALPYSPDDFYRCPLRVLRDRTAHCFDGALFAAALLQRLGRPPLLLDLLSNGRDDEHMLALFKLEGRWGAIAKSNCTGLRYRDPVFRTLRELVLSYFPQYFNVERERTLRGYSGPFNLRAFERWQWQTADAAADRIAARTERARKIVLIDERLGARLSPVDARCYAAGMLGANLDALFRPGR